jgi:hypothetical protein
VVGDALATLDKVRPFADHVRVVDIDGDPVDVADLMSQAEATASQTFDVSGLEPQELEYGIMYQGNEIGSATVRWTRDGGTFAVVSDQQLPGMAVTQTTEFDAATFAPIRTRTEAGSMGEFGIEVSEGRATGTGFDPQQGPQDIDVEVPQGTALEGQFGTAMAVTDFGAVNELTVNVLTGAGAIQAMTVTVDGEETIEVPAGTFETYRLRQGGQAPMTVWVTKSAPHIVVKRELAAQPVSIVLKSM